MERPDYIIAKSTRPNKKFMLITPEMEKIHFGQLPYEDYLSHRDPVRRKMYLIRHQKEMPFWTHTKKNLRRPSYLSRHILWGATTKLKEAVDNLEKKQNIDIKIDDSIKL